MMKKYYKNQKGSMLVTAIVILSVIAAMVVAIPEITQVEREQAADDASINKAKFAAFGGMEYLLYKLSVGDALPSEYQVYYLNSNKDIWFKNENADFGSAFYYVDEVEDTAKTVTNNTLKVIGGHGSASTSYDLKGNPTGFTSSGVTRTISITKKTAAECVQLSLYESNSARFCHEDRQVSAKTLTGYETIRFHKFKKYLRIYKFIPSLYPDYADCPTKIKIDRVHVWWDPDKDDTNTGKLYSIYNYKNSSWKYNSTLYSNDQDIDLNNELTDTTGTILSNSQNCKGDDMATCYIKDLVFEWKNLGDTGGPYHVRLEFEYSDGSKSIMEYSPEYMYASGTTVGMVDYPTDPCTPDTTGTTADTTGSTTDTASSGDTIYGADDMTSGTASDTTGDGTTFGGTKTTPGTTTDTSPDLTKEGTMDTSPGEVVADPYAYPDG